MTQCICMCHQGMHAAGSVIVTIMVLAQGRSILCVHRNITAGVVDDGHLSNGLIVKDTEMAEGMKTAGTVGSVKSINAGNMKNVTVEDLKTVATVGDTMTKF